MSTLDVKAAGAKTDQASDMEADFATGKVVDAYGQIEVFAEEEKNRVKRRVDFFLLPLLCGCYIFSVGLGGNSHSSCGLTNRTVFSFWTKLFSIIVLSSASKRHFIFRDPISAGWAGKGAMTIYPKRRKRSTRADGMHSIYYFGYMLGSVMWSQVARRHPRHIGKTISACMLIWSSLTLLFRKLTHCTRTLLRRKISLTAYGPAVCSNFGGAATIRFFLGFFESVTGAVFVMITSNWWTRQEQAFRSAFWLGGTPVSSRIRI